jgi:hypothetical protein
MKRNAIALALVLLLLPIAASAQGLPIKSGASGSLATVDATSLAVRQSEYDARGNFSGQKATYSAALTAKTATAAGTNPFFAICGSATKTIRVQNVTLNYTVATAGVHADPRLQKTSTATSGGTATALVKVPHDSTSGAATASLVNYYTALATSGTVVGTIDIQMAWAQITATVTAGSATPYRYEWYRRDAEAVVLRGTSECLQGSFGTTTTNAPTMTVSVVWTEE